MSESAQEVHHGGQQQILSTATGDGDKTTDETAASIILKNTPPSSPYKSAICSPQMSPSTNNPAKCDEVKSPSKAEHEVKISSSTSMDANVDSKETPETTVVEASKDQQAADVKPTLDDTGSKGTKSSAQADNNVTAADKTAECADIDVKVEQTDDQKQKKSNNKNVGDNKKSSNEAKSASTKSNRKKDRSPLGSRANRRHSNSASNNDGYNNRGGYNNHPNNNYANRGNTNRYAGNYNSGGRYNGGGYPTGGYRQQNRYHRTTVQNNYGLKSPPYKSNFEPSDSARQKADEFVRASTIGTM